MGGFHPIKQVKDVGQASGPIALATLASNASPSLPVPEVTGRRGGALASQVTKRGNTMSDRITKVTIRKRCEAANTYMAKLGIQPLKVEMWNPGDGVIRYQIETSNGHRLINAYGARDAYDKLNAFMEGIYHATDAVKNGTFEPL